MKIGEWLPAKILICLTLYARVSAKHGDMDPDDDTTSTITATTGTASTIITSMPSPSKISTFSASSHNSIVSGSPNSSSTVVFQFDPPQNAETCQASRFSWISGGSKSFAVTIIATNEPTSNVSNLGRRSFESRTLTTNISSLADSFSWPVVDVPEGSYNLIAFDTARSVGMFVISPSFSITNGSDTSCLATDVVAQSSISVTASPSAAHGKGEGALIGIVIGGIFGFLSLILIAFVLLIWRKKAKRARFPPPPPYPGAPFLRF